MNTANQLCSNYYQDTLKEVRKLRGLQHKFVQHLPSPHPPLPLLTTSLPQNISVIQLEEITSLEKTDCPENCCKGKDFLTKLTAKLNPIFSNITKEEWKAQHNFRKDDSCMVLTVDKGAALVTLDRHTS